MLFRQLFDRDTWTYTYLLADEETGEAVMIDPVAENVDTYITLLEELGLTLKYSFETHIHADHISGSGLLRQKLGAKTVLSKNAGVDCADEYADTGNTYAFGRYAIESRLTPGHTSGCVSFVAHDGDRTMAFTGDTLFIRGCGRTDFQQGDARTLYDSVHAQIFSLPDDAIIYPGHDYKGNTRSTVAEEKAHNPRLRTTIDQDGFVAIMDALDLAHPRFIHVALPANNTCGMVPQDNQPTVN